MTQKIYKGYLNGCYGCIYKPIWTVCKCATTHNCIGGFIFINNEE